MAGGAEISIIAVLIAIARLVALVFRNDQAVQSMPSLLKNILFRISASRRTLVQLSTSM